jgi:hypothetical protein
MTTKPYNLMLHYDPTAVCTVMVGTGALMHPVCGQSEEIGVTQHPNLVECTKCKRILATTAPEKMFLVCIGCGEAFDSMTAAHEHGVFIPGPDPSWCGEEGFNIMPESEAL